METRKAETGTLQNSFVYDNDNNLIAKKDGSGNTMQALSYDPKGRAVTINTNGVGISTALSYDPMDYRIAKSDSRGSLIYLLEAERIDAIMNGSQFQADYMRGSVVDEVANGFHRGVIAHPKGYRAPVRPGRYRAAL
jgi:YD repeat-containing protein